MLTEAGGTTDLSSAPGPIGTLRNGVDVGRYTIASLTVDVAYLRLLCYRILICRCIDTLY